MSFEFIHRADSDPRRVAVFPGAFNPPTTAHVHIARRALAAADEVVWVLPRSFPHKEYQGATLRERARMLELICAANARFSAAISHGSLFVDIAAEAAEAYGDRAEILLACGRDAAERIARWDYGVPGVFEQLISRYRLLVVSREGHFGIEQEQQGRIICLAIDPSLDEVSSTRVRERLGQGVSCEKLVPLEIAAMARRIYGPKGDLGAPPEK